MDKLKADYNIGNNQGKENTLQFLFNETQMLMTSDHRLHLITPVIWIIFIGIIGLLQDFFQKKYFIYNPPKKSIQRISAFKTCMV